MVFPKNESVWVTFRRPAQFALEETVEALAAFQAGDKVEAKIIRDKEGEEEYVIELLTPQLFGYWWNLPKNRYSISKRYVKNEPPTYSIFSVYKRDVTLKKWWVENLKPMSELIYLPHGCFLPGCENFINKNEAHCEYIPVELFDIAGSLLSQLEKKPWGQQGEGNVFFNPDRVLTYEDDAAAIGCALQHLQGTPIEVDAEAWDIYFNILPPLKEYCYCHIGNDSWYLEFLMGEGSPLTGGFIREGKYYLIGVPADALISKHGDRTIAVTANHIFFNRR
jgi:hypothetical protein